MAAGWKSSNLIMNMEGIGMKKNILLLVGMACLLLTAACSSISTSKSESAKSVQVEVKTVQETLQSGRGILIDALVTHDSEKVKDAQEVKFEIWKKDQEKRQTITAKHWQDGLYRIQTMFPDDGIYYVVAHVKAGDDMHITPQKELVVGKVTSS